jgi:hypothetical protein
MLFFSLYFSLRGKVRFDIEEEEGELYFFGGEEL